jgi:hypothetical protein
MAYRGQGVCDLLRSARVEFVLNLKTTKALGLTVPPILLALPTR